MPRPREQILKKLSLLELCNDITPSNSIIPTEFRIITFSTHFVYKFLTNTGNEYNLEFFEFYEQSETKLTNKKTIGCILNRKKNNINSIYLDLSLIKYKNDIDDAEKGELIGRILYMLKVGLKRDKKTKVFVIGNYNKTNRKKYKEFFNFHFSEVFKLYYGKSQCHPFASLVIIRKNKRKPL